MTAQRRLLVALAVVVAWPALAAQETAEIYQGSAAETFLKKARVVATQKLGTGITEPDKVTLAINGVTHFGVFKNIDEYKPGMSTMADGTRDLGYQDSWQTEIAAYIVDRIIGLGLVPATVERGVKGKTGSLQWFVQSEMTEAQRVERKVAPPDLEAWNRLMFKVRLFDQLIANVDRHMKNLLVTKEFDVRLIDHSRSFRPTKDLKAPGDLTRFSRSLLDGIARLEKKDLTKQTKRYLRADQIDSLLRRRDAIVALAKKLIAERGAAAVIYP